METKKVQRILEQTANQLRASGLSAEHYCIPSFSGYSPVMQVPQTDVYCLEARLGPTYQRAGYSSYAAAQIFDPEYPSMALILMISRQDEDNSLDSVQPVYTPGLDKAFSDVFLPLMHTAFNSLDPTGGNKGQLVQAYNARMTLSDFPQATVLSVKIISRFKKDGQLASIAVDFEDPFQTAIAKLLKPMRFIRDLHHIPRTAQRSAIQIPFKSSTDTPYLITDSSTALDQGFAIAKRYLNEHYRTVRQTV